MRTPTIRCQTIIARSRLIHATKSLGLSEATIEDGRGRLLGHATSRCVLFRLDPEIMASRRHVEVQTSSSADPYLRPVEGHVRGREFWNSMSGREIMDKVATGDFVPPCYLLVGLRGVESGDGLGTLALGKSPWLCNAFGVIYGGAIAYLADATMIIATGSTVPAGTAFNTIDLKINFLRPVLPGEGELHARATVVHRGRTIALVNCDILDAADKLAAQATASFLLLPGRFWERPVQVADEVPSDTGRVLTTVLFVDVVDSTRHAAELGDRRWRDAIADYQSAVREQLQRFNGTEIDSVGDGFLATFDSAVRAVRCARSIRDAVRRAGVEVRAAVHTGECERSNGKLVGLAVHVGSRIESMAGSGEILVSSIVKDLVADSAIEFEPRGEHELKGISGRWPIFAARP